jgi:hypothetical protein
MRRKRPLVSRLTQLNAKHNEETVMCAFVSTLGERILNLMNLYKGNTNASRREIEAPVTETTEVGLDQGAVVHSMTGGTIEEIVIATWTDLMEVLQEDSMTGGGK